jgi:hypothetical protein
MTITAQDPIITTNTINKNIIKDTVDHSKPLDIEQTITETTGKMATIKEKKKKNMAIADTEKNKFELI